MRVLTDVRLFTGGADLTGNNNKVELSAEVEEKDVTVFRSSGTGLLYKEVIAGLASTMVSAEGYWEAGDSSKVDDALWAQQGGLSGWTIAPDTADVGDVAYLTRAMQGSYAVLGTVGDVAPWKASVTGTWPLVRGQIAHPPGVARTLTGAGTAVQAAAVPADGNLYAALHVLSVAGDTPSLTVEVQSDADDEFSSPATQITFADATAVGGQILRSAGPTDDTWYRVAWTITGTTPSFLFVVSLGVS